MPVKARSFGLVLALIVVGAIGLIWFVDNISVCDKDVPRQHATEMYITQLADAIEMFYLDHDRYPVILKDLLEKPKYIAESKWPSSGYIDRLRKDGWEREYLYIVRTGGNPGFTSYTIASYGKDGIKGGDGFDKDIVKEGVHADSILIRD